MAAAADLSTRFALDVQAVNGLRVTAARTGQAGLEAAARQFEALFLNMMMKSMREATPEDSLMDSGQSRLFMSMLDQQLAQSMASRGVGLADVMIRQLRHAAPPDPAAMPNPPGPSGPSAPPVQPDLEQLSGSGARAQLLPYPEQREIPRKPVPHDRFAQPPVQAETGRLSGQVPPRSDVQAEIADFQARLMPYAQQASQATGIPAVFMLGQAALESGWGRREIRGADGTQSFNLFGVKAGSSWKGAVVETVTTEYVNGTARKSVEKFRAYSSYAEAFHDYANLLRSNPRYADVVSQAAQGLDADAFAQGLQSAGYATDPRYAEKLGRIIRTTAWSF